jgi:hypothetical protein
MIKTILIISLLATLLMAKNPVAYAALGDIIYNNVEKIEKLKAIDAYKLYIKDISEYVDNVHKTKESGFLIDSPDSILSKQEYLVSLRKLSKKNDYFVRSVNINYITAMREENHVLFSQLINSGLIDTQTNKQEIIDYYFNHSDDIDPTGVIQVYLDEDAKLKAKREALAKRYKTKQMLEKEKIERIRKNDKIKQEELEKELQEEVRKKKVEIREYQKSELSN